MRPPTGRTLTAVDNSALVLTHGNYMIYYYYCYYYSCLLFFLLIVATSPASAGTGFNSPISYV